jgi:hypothetical protein
MNSPPYAELLRLIWSALKWCKDWRSRNPEGLYEALVQKWRNEFEPADKPNVGVSELSKARSDSRIDFCKKVIARAWEIVDILDGDPDWTNICHDVSITSPGTIALC